VALLPRPSRASERLPDGTLDLVGHAANCIQTSVGLDITCECEVRAVGAGGHRRVERVRARRTRGRRPCGLRAGATA
jgi:hypothetical protein